VDPSSPFNFGALLGDRVRMSDFYLNPHVFIRSVASRGSLGGLSAHLIEMLDILKSSCFDYVFVETVGVGQSEVEIAGIADTTIVALVPEAGDEIQTMKAGVMEIADIFIVNKGDRSHADEFVKNLRILAHSKARDWEIPVVKTVASEGQGIRQVVQAIEAHQQLIQSGNRRHLEMLTIKAFQLIQQKRMQNVHKEVLQKDIEHALASGNFNLYRFVADWS
jgi:LAO/AO transport system kinase